MVWCFNICAQNQHLAFTLFTYTAVNMSQTLKAAVLIVSTTASKDPSTDAAAQTLQSVFQEDGAGQWDVVDTKIVPDSVVEIQRQVMLWTDAANNVNLIVTTGGTGFAVSDQTPEVCHASVASPISCHDRILMNL